MKSRSKNSDGMTKKLSSLKSESENRAVAYARQNRQTAILQGSTSHRPLSLSSGWFSIPTTAAMARASLFPEPEEK